MIKKLIKKYQSLIYQLTKFGIVGVSAAIVNYISVVFLVETFALKPLVANIFAYMAAFCVSFSGHKYWTFSTHNTTKSSIPKFLAVSLSSFFANEGLFYIFLHQYQLNYKLALLLVLIIVPPFTFLFSKLWAFRHQEQHLTVKEP